MPRTGARRGGRQEREYLVAGANVIQQSLRMGLLDEIQIHLIPVLLGGGIRLLEDLGPVSRCWPRWHTMGS